MRSASTTGSDPVVQSSRSAHRKCCALAEICVMTSSLKATRNRQPELRHTALSGPESSYVDPTTLDVSNRLNVFITSLSLSAQLPYCVLSFF